jgi:uncharacterized protein DUF4169
MTADVVNLRRARKAKSRVDREKTAAANRVTFGRARIDKAKEAAERERAVRALDGHRRDDK